MKQLPIAAAMKIVFLVFGFTALFGWTTGFLPDVWFVGFFFGLGGLLLITIRYLER